MKTLFRFVVMFSISGASAMVCAQYPVENVIVTNPVVVNGAVLSPIPETIVYQEGTVISHGPVVNQGVVYANGSYPVHGSVNQVSYATSIPGTPVMGGATDGLLSVINQKRRRSGLRPLMLDPQLSQIAQNKSSNRARRRITGHDGSSRGGARVEGVGYAYGGNLTQRFNTCYMYSNGYTYAGAGIAYDNSGRAYYTLLLR